MRIHRPVARARRVGAGLLLGTAVLQAASPLLAGFDQGDADDPTLVPPGPFFGVWGVVVLGSLAHAVWGLPDRRSGTTPYRQVQMPLSIVHVLFAAWLLAAVHLPWLTLPIFAVMLAVLIFCLRTVLATTPMPRATRWLLGGTLGIYAGWSSAAVWINAVTVLPADLVNTSTLGTWLQAGAALAATATSCLVTQLVDGWPPYVLTTAWALIGVTISGVRADEPAIWTTAVAGLLVVGITAGRTLARRHRTSRR